MQNKILLVFLFFCFNSFSQNEKVLGKWYGQLNVMGTSLRFNMDINLNQEEINVVLASPDQKAYGIKTDTSSFIKDTLFFKSNGLRASYKGVFVNNKIEGFFMQRGMEFELNFQRDSIVKEKPQRPQEPIPPFNYYTKAVIVKNKKGGIELAGTLTLPSKEGKFPVVILVSGSGPQNRDSEILRHKPFLVWADYLAKNGIGTFRYDERGVGKSTGKYVGSDLNDFYSDLKSVVKTIGKRKEVKSLGVLGHSEGGIIAPWLASENCKVDFVIMLAGAGVPVTELMAEQRKLISGKAGISNEDIETNNKMFEEINKAVISLDETILNDSLFAIMTSAFNKMENESYKNLPYRMQVAQQVVAQVTTPWYKSFISVNPTSYLTKIKKPVLAINGDKDLQVAAYQNIPAIEKALKEGKCKNYTTKIYPGLNHLFQKCETGMVSEYSEIEETINPEVLKDVTIWIKGLPK